MFIMFMTVFQSSSSWKDVNKLMIKQHLTPVKEL